MHVRLFENFQNLWHFKFDAFPSQKSLRGWQMELSLEQIVLGVEYAKNSKIQRVIHISCGGYLNALSKD